MLLWHKGGSSHSISPQNFGTKEYHTAAMLSTMQLNLSRDLRNDETESIRLIGLLTWLIVDAPFSTDPDKVFMVKMALVEASRAASTFASSGTLSWFRAGSWTEEPESISGLGASMTMDGSEGKDWSVLRSGIAC